MQPRSPEEQPSQRPGPTPLPWTEPQTTGISPETIPPVEGPATGSPKSETVLSPTPLGAGGETPALSLPGYEILGTLGEGGMGVVYKARHLALNRVVALKMILGGAHARPEERQRFKAEAEAAARLTHPNIVQIYEVGEWQGQPYFSLEFVEGGSLAQQLNGIPLLPRRGAELVRALAKAVHYAHEHGIVHRDLKPANVLLGSGPSATGDRPEKDRGSQRDLFGPIAVKVADFGLARIIDAQIETDPERRTPTGTILGTPNYMAPEQAAGSKDVGPSADTYALGAILYECLTGRPPFQGPSLLETLEQVRSQEPVPPTRLQVKLPLELQTICLKCLQKDPQKRYVTAAALADDLGRFLRGETILARPASRWEKARKWARRRPAAAALLAVSVLAAAALVSVVLVAHRRLGAERDKALHERSVAEGLRDRARQELVRHLVSTGSERAGEGDLTAALGLFLDALALDQEDSARADRHRTRVASVLSGCPRVVRVWPHARTVRHLDISPDGKRLVTASEDGKARVWDIVSGAPVGFVLAHDKPVRMALFSPDGRRVLTAGEDGRARVWQADTGRLLVTVRHGWDVLCAAFSPDGKRLVTAGDDASARMWDAQTGKAIGQPLKHTRPVRWAAFSPNGKRVVTASEDRTARLWEAATGDAEALPLKHDKEVWQAVWSPNGQSVATASEDGTAQVWDAETGRAQTGALLHDHPVWRVAFSPDSTRVVTASADRTARVWHASSGRPVTPPLGHGHHVLMASFSPDGRFVLTASEDQSVRLWDAHSGLPAFPPLKHGQGVRLGVFGPDGRQVLTATGDGTVRLWRLDAGRADAVSVYHGKEVSHATFSKDGRRLATASHDGTARIWDAISGQPLGQPLRHSDWVYRVDFSPDGERVVTASKDGTARVWETATGRPLTPPLRHASWVPFATFSPDGHFVVTASRDGTAQVWDARTGKPASLPLRHGERLTLVPPADGSRIARGTDLGKDRRDRLREAVVALTVLLQRPGVRPPTSRPPVYRPPSFRPPRPYQPRPYQPRPSQPARGPVPRDYRPWDPFTRQRTASPAWPWRQGAEEPGGLFRSFVLRPEVHTAFFSADGRHVLTAGEDKSARVWEVATGKAAAPPFRHHDVVNHAAFSPDGKRAVTASGFRAQVWEVATGDLLSADLQHGGTVYLAEFSPDGSRLVTASADGTARVWDAQRYRPVTPPLRHGLSVHYVEFSADGRRLLTVSSQYARVWDVASGEPLIAPLKGAGEVTDARFSPDGNRVVTAGREGTAHVWTLPRPDARPLADLRKLEQLLIGQQKEEGDRSVPLKGDALHRLCQYLGDKYSAESALADERTLRWHRRAAEESEAERDWQASAFQRSRLIAAAGTPDAGLFAARGRAHAEQGKWREAVADLRRAVELKGQAETRCWLAVALLRADDQEGYRRACTELFERYGRDETAARWVLRACVLLAKPAINSGRLLAMARQAAARRPRDAEVRALLGAVLCRVGRNQEAVWELTEALFLSHARGGGNETDELAAVHFGECALASIPGWLAQPGAGAWNAVAQPLIAEALIDHLNVSGEDALWLALAHHHLSDYGRESEKWLKREHTEGRSRSGGAGGPDWLTRAERELLRKEIRDARRKPP